MLHAESPDTGKRCPGIFFSYRTAHTPPRQLCPAPARHEERLAMFPHGGKPLPPPSFSIPFRTLKKRTRRGRISTWDVVRFTLGVDETTPNVSSSYTQCSNRLIPKCLFRGFGQEGKAAPAELPKHGNDGRVPVCERPHRDFGNPGGAGNTRKTDRRSSFRGKQLYDNRLRQYRRDKEYREHIAGNGTATH